MEFQFNILVNKSHGNVKVLILNITGLILSATTISRKITPRGIKAFAVWQVLRFKRTLLENFVIKATLFPMIRRNLNGIWEDFPNLDISPQTFIHRLSYWSAFFFLHAQVIILLIILVHFNVIYTCF